MRTGLFVIVLLAACNVRVNQPHVAIFSTVESLMRSDTTRTGFFTNASLFDSSYTHITYEATQGRVTVPNDGSQNFLLCRYDTSTMQPVWVAVGGGSGRDGGCNYYTVPPENSVYVVGYFEDTAFFPHRAGMQKSDTLISNGMTDMFVAKYAYDTGVLQWVRSGGSRNSDVQFIYNGQRHTETHMSIDSAAVTVYANFFGPAFFNGKFFDAKTSGSAVQIRYAKESGEVIAVNHPATLP